MGDGFLQAGFPGWARGQEDGFLHGRVEVEPGVTLHVVRAQPAAATQRGGAPAPLVVLLHGFPEFWWSWRGQLSALSEAGFEVLAPDLRGYNLSDKPAGVKAYALPRLAEDVAALIRASGRGKAHVVGHDWGGGVAWEFAMHHGELLDRLAIVNVPHHVRMMAGLRTPRQALRSWYMGFFQLPWLPERTLLAGDGALLRMAYQSVMPRADADRYVEAARQPGALTAMVNYYRAMARSALSGGVRRPQPVAAPVLVVWGDDDRYLGKELAVPPARLVPDARVVFLPGVGHWVQAQAGPRLSELLEEHFVAEGEPTRRRPSLH